MDFSFTPEQEAFRQSVREFLRRECPPELARRCDEEKEYPFPLYRKMAELGWIGLPFPEEYGGAGGTAIDVALLIEELARGMLAAAQVFGAVIYVGGPINRFGTPEQRKRFLPPLCRGELQLAFALTEPNSGSDAAALRARARRNGSRYLLTGSKIFCSRAHIADYILVAARTNPEAKKQEGISLFLMPRKQTGVKVSLIEKLGVRAVGTCEVVMEDAEVPVENLLGQENKGWDHLVGCLGMERFYMAAMCTGGIAAVLDLATAYAKQREQFDKPIGQFQAIQHKLADIYVDLQASRLLTYQSAWLATHGKDGRLEGSAAKLFASEAYMRAALQGMQIMGGYGYMMEFDMQRHFRDAKVMEIGGGTSEIHRTILGTGVQR